MLNTSSRSLLIGGWLTMLVCGLGLSIAAGATLATCGFLLVLGVAPVVVMILIAGGAPAPTVAEILHSVDARDGR